MEAIVKLIKTNKQPIRLVKYLLKKAEAFYRASTIDSGDPKTVLKHFTERIGEKPKGGRPVAPFKHILISPQYQDETGGIVAEDLLPKAGQDWIDTYAPGCRYLIVGERLTTKTGKRPHLHMLILNDINGQALRWNRDDIKDMVTMRWTRTFEMGAYGINRDKKPEIKGVTRTNLSEFITLGDPCAHINRLIYSGEAVPYTTKTGARGIFYKGEKIRLAQINYARRNAGLKSGIGDDWTEIQLDGKRSIIDRVNYADWASKAYNKPKARLDWPTAPKTTSYQQQLLGKPSPIKEERTIFARRLNSVLKGYFWHGVRFDVPELIVLGMLIDEDLLPAYLVFLYALLLAKLLTITPDSMGKQKMSLKGHLERIQQQQGQKPDLN